MFAETYFSYALFGTLVFILDIVAIVSILGRNSSTERKILWTGVVVLLPFLGMILYFILGRDRRDALIPRI